MKKKQRISEVDSTDPVIQKILKKLHRYTFLDDPFPEFGIGYWWIAYEGTKPVGFCGMHKSASQPNGSYLVRAGVMKAARGQGLQRKFIKVREKKALKLGHEVLTTETTDNVHSANNLIKSGFVLYEPKVAYAFKHSNYWRKVIKDNGTTVFNKVHSKPSTKTVHRKQSKG